MVEQPDPLYERIEQIRIARIEREKESRGKEGNGTTELGYRRHAYYFVLDLVDYTIGALGKEQQEGEARHVECRDLMEHAPHLANHEFGPLANLVFTQWKMPTMDDLGEVVSDLIEGELLARLPTDSIGEFQTGRSIVKG